MFEKKPLAIFLAVVFGLTIALALVARSLGFSLYGTERPLLLSQLIVAGAMFLPALAAVVTQKIVRRRSLRELGFRFGPWREYLKSYGIVVALFALNYAITWIFIAPPDFTLQALLSQFRVAVPDISLPLPAPVMVAIFAGITFLASPVLNMIPSLGEEIGWRGFLLPVLEPLGRKKAAIVSGLIWGLWHTPLIFILGFAYGSRAWPGFLLHLAVVSGLGVWMATVWYRTRSVILAAFIHSVFNANAYGIWAMIFVGYDPLIVGAVGVTNAAIWLVFGWFKLREMKSNVVSVVR